MKPTLSVLDPSPLFTGQSARAALSQTLRLAEALDGSAYRAFWVQEHHNAASFAGTSPEIMLAALSQRTQYLKLGSGGVMLPNYSPLKIAEQFCTLAALAPGRIELGVGRATGADLRTSAALLGPGADAFPSMFQLLLDWLADAAGEAAIDAAHRARGIHVGAHGNRPDVWMLCSSAQSAAFAGAMGVKLAYADFLSPGGAGDAFTAYRAAFVPSAFTRHPYCAIALVAFAAETTADADRLTAPLQAWRTARLQGEFSPFPLAAETAHINQPGTHADQAFIGSGREVALQIQALSRKTGADEMFLLTVAESFDDRLRSYTLIAENILDTAQ
jgi:luciferase family oxidoreductase group 1